MHPIAHFCLGYSVTMVIVIGVVLVRPRLRHWFYRKENIAIVVFISILGGLFADLPDLDYLLGTYPSLQTALGDICFFHSTFDGIVQNENDLWTLIEFVSLFVMTNFYVFLYVADPIKELKGLYGRVPEEDEFLLIE